MRNLITIVLIFYNSFIHAKTFVSVSDGAWDNPSIWDLNDGTYPSLTDDVILNHTVSARSSDHTETRALTINASGVLNLNSSHEFRFRESSGTLNNNGTINGPGTLRPVPVSTIGGSGTYSNVSLRKTNSAFYIGSDIDLVGISLEGGADMYISSGVILTVNGPISINHYAGEIINRGIIILNSNSFLTGAYGPSTAFSSVIGDIVCSVTDLPVPRDSYKNVTISNTTSCSADISVSGNWINNGTFTSSGSSTITFSGSSIQTLSGSGINNFENITLNNSNGLSLNSGTVNISEVMSSTNGTFTQNGANIILKSTASNSAGMIKVSSSSEYSYSSGNFTTERFYNASSPGWRMLGAPIQNSTLNDWDDEFYYCGFTGSDYSYHGCGNFCSVWFYDETSAQIGNSGAGFDSATNITNSTTPDNGSIIYTGQGAITLSVTGTPEFRDRSFSVTKSGADAAFGFNLISNPYPCSLDWTSFRADNTFLDNGYYIYQADAGNYLSVSGSGTIPHSQGFFVKKTSTGTSTLNLSTSQTVNTQANFTKSVNGINLPLTLKLTSNNNSYYDFAHVNTDINYSNNYDPGEDIFELFSPYPDYVPNLFFLDNQGNQLDRTSINNNNSVDLLFDAKIGQFSHGSYTINFENLSQFMIGSCLTLEDLHNGLLTDLRVDSSYTFLSDSTAPSPRFKLFIDVDYNINVINNECYQDSSALITLSGDSIVGSLFNLLDSNGILIDSVIAIQDSINFFNLNAGIYNLSTNHIGRCSIDNQNIIVIEPEEVIADFHVFNDTLYLDSNGFSQINFSNLSNGAEYYNWNFGDGNISYLSSPSHNFSSPGTYNVNLEAKNDSIGTCSSTHNKLITVINPFIYQSIDQISSNILIHVSNKFLDLTFQNNLEKNSNLELYSLDGRLVHKVNSLKTLNSYNLSKLNNGIYIIKISNSLNYKTVFLDKFFLN